MNALNALNDFNDFFFVLINEPQCFFHTISSWHALTEGKKEEGISWDSSG